MIVTLPCPKLFTTNVHRYFFPRISCFAELRLGSLFPLTRGPAVVPPQLLQLYRVFNTLTRP